MSAKTTTSSSFPSLKRYFTRLLSRAPTPPITGLGCPLPTMLPSLLSSPNSRHKYRGPSWPKDRRHSKREGSRQPRRLYTIITVSTRTL